MTVLDCAGKVLDLSRVRVMGILNITPDSFSDGGKFFARDAALAQAERMLAEGADLLDIGGESTRPGAAPVSLDQELERVIPVIEALRGLPVPLSVDTSKPEVMRAAVRAGAGLINDVYALRQPGALEAAAEAGVPVCLMHMQGEPRSMQAAPRYADVVAEVCEFLAGRLRACVQAGIPPSRLLIDPGFGFGKSAQHNLVLLKHLHELRVLQAPILAGLSRKSLIDKVLGGRIPEERLAGSLALAVLAVQGGASIIRVHDIAATVDALRMTEAVLRA
ncbi:MAG: dihydropteroate synthase [Gammaproteobacteria bacterium]|nr:dihydropteroate synthase [Gammaproteobacteria bacterium]